MFDELKNLFGHDVDPGDTTPEKPSPTEVSDIDVAMVAPSASAPQSVGIEFKGSAGTTMVWSGAIILIFVLLVIAAYER